MSARKVADSSGAASAATSHLPLNLNTFRVRKNGIEFQTDKPLALWKELTLDLQTPIAAKKIHCTGIVVACDGSRHMGYTVSMVITNISRHSQEMLELLSASRLQ